MAREKIMIRLLLIEGKDKIVRNYVICPHCNVKILYAKRTPYLCPMCQTDIPSIIPYLDSLTTKLHYYKTDPCTTVGFV
jgi:DNA-directed RNA polymerase subunit RPC12/RpoP